MLSWSCHFGFIVCFICVFWFCVVFGPFPVFSLLFSCGPHHSAFPDQPLPPPSVFQLFQPVSPIPVSSVFPFTCVSPLHSTCTSSPRQFWLYLSLCSPCCLCQFILCDSPVLFIQDCSCVSQFLPVVCFWFCVYLIYSLCFS